MIYAHDHAKCPGLKVSIALPILCRRVCLFNIALLISFWHTAHFRHNPFSCGVPPLTKFHGQCSTRSLINLVSLLCSQPSSMLLLQMPITPPSEFEIPRNVAEEMVIHMIHNNDIWSQSGKRSKRSTDHNLDMSNEPKQIKYDHKRARNVALNKSKAPLISISVYGLLMCLLPAITQQINLPYTNHGFFPNNYFDTIL